MLRRLFLWRQKARNLDRANTKAGFIKTLMLASLSVGMLFIAATGAYAAFSEMIVFGNSLSDSGNVYVATANLIPADPYYDGRFSNGPTYADLLAAELQLELEPFLVGGSNYAVAGARTPSFPDGLPYDFLSQIDIFELEVLFGIRDEPDENALYVVFIGSNDLMDIIDDALDDPQNQTTIIQNGIADVVGNIRSGLNDLRDQGAINILVPNLPNVGRTPKFIQKESSSTGAISLATSATEDFNEELDTMLDTFDDINIIRFDTYSLLEEAVANPGAFGLSNTTEACYTGDDDYTGGGTVCATPESYLFWDEIHPSAKSHQLLASHLLPNLVGFGSLGTLISGDFNGDGLDDLAVTRSTGEVSYSVDLSTWLTIPGVALFNLVSGDFNLDGRDDLAGISSSGKVYYTVDLATWVNIPGTLEQIAVGDLNNDGRDDLAGTTFSDLVFYTLDLASWQHIPGALRNLTTGDFNGNGADDLAGIAPDGGIYYTTNLATWQNIPGQLNTLTSADLNNDGFDDLAGLTLEGQIYYSIDLAVWQRVPGALMKLTTGDFDGDGVSDLAGLAPNGQAFLTLNLSTWQGLSSPGFFERLAAGNFDGGGHDDLATSMADSRLYVTYNFTDWTGVPFPF